jgi:BirA family biotin operon repressor/biotin-[acetyl-CoA-carboxylase] ligase
MSDHEDSRPPIDLTADDLTADDLTAGASPRWRIEVVEETTSTNADVAERFRSGEHEGLVLVAEHQTSGRGRLGRQWVTPARSSLTVSFLLEPGDVSADRWPWLPLLTGIAAAAAVRRVTGVEVALKWPNDVLADGQKLGGILLERVDRDGAAAAVVGIGINCAQTTEELPVPQATSLSIVTGAPVDRTALLAALIDELAARYDEWRSGADLRAAYLELCRTPGQQVRVAVPSGEVVGEAVDVDESGRLVVRTESGEEHLGAGDVVHVRPERG